MEAGYDYLLLRGRLQRKLLRYLGIIAMTCGALLLAGGGAYYGYAEIARSNLDDLNATAPAAVAPPAPASTSAGPPAQGPGDSAALDQPPNPAAAAPVASAPALDQQTARPAESLPAGAVVHPWVYRLSPHREQMLQLGFTPIEFYGTTPGESLNAATRISIPAVGIESTIEELEILELGDSRAYETPDSVVGHIPETANPGESGSAWFFGHTESPIQGEGSVFFNLRQIPGMLSRGEQVFVITDNGSDQYLYRVTSSHVVHQDDLSLYEADGATIHLVACVPRWVYDHRLIVTGELLGQKSSL